MPREFNLQPEKPDERDEEWNRFLAGLPFVKGIRIHKNDVEVIRGKRSDENPPPTEPRGEVAEFSYRSRQRLAFVAANTETVFKSMLTLTYPAEFPSDGRTVKGHLNSFMTSFRRKTQGRYLWFLEFQKRGAPHFHILSEFELPEPHRIVTRRNGTSWTTNKEYDDWAAKRWYETVGSEDLSHWLAGTSWEAIRNPEGGCRYAVKYAFKMEQKVVPDGYENVGRMWGHSKEVKPPEPELIPLTPSQIRELLVEGDEAPREFRYIFGAADRARAILGSKGLNLEADGDTLDS